MKFSREELEEIENYYGTRPRDPGAPSFQHEAMPEIIPGAPSTAGGEFSVRDLLDLLEYQEGGQFPDHRPPPPPELSIPDQYPGGAYVPPGMDAADIHGHPESDKLGPPASRDMWDQMLGTTPIESQGVQQGFFSPEEIAELENYGGPQQPQQGGVLPPEVAGPQEEQLGMGGFPNQPMAQAGPDGVLPVEEDEYYQNIDTDRLHGQVNRQREAIMELGKEPPQKDENPGMMNRIFDVLLRPNYAMAEGVNEWHDRATEARDQGEGVLGSMMNTGFFSGAKEGITGREKTIFSDVLDKMGVENSVVRGVGGFALDVGLDPTTYLTGGIAKAGTRGAAETAAMKAAQNVENSPQALDAARRAADQKIRAEVTGNLLDGKKKAGPKLADLGVDKLAEKELRSLAQDAGRAALQAAQTPGKVNFKFAGKHIGSSEKLYSGISRAFKPLRERPVVDSLNVMFRPAKEWGDLHEFSRFHEGLSVAQFQDHLKFFREQTKHLNPVQSKQISEAIEGVRHLDDPQLLETKNMVERMFKEFWDAEVAAGIHAADAVPRTNYLYHVYKVGSESADSYKASATKKGAPGFTKERKYPTLAEAKKDGMRPVEDIREIVAHRAAKHFQEMSHQSFMTDAIENFGLRTGSKEAKKVEAHLKGMGIRLEKVTLPGAKHGEALFPEPVARVLNDFKTIKEKDKAAQTVLRHIDKVHQETKFWMTVANPGHHVRNFVGNAYMAYQDGVRNPKRYADAARAVAGDIAPKGSKLHQQAIDTKVKVGNGFSSLDELMDLYKLTGTKSGFYDMEIPRRLDGKAKNVIRTASTGREDTARLGHFIDALKKEAKSSGKNWAKMSKPERVEFAKSASRRVRKFQLDYGDLTSFEKSVPRRIAMFYTFARKNTALQLEMLALRPGKIANVPKTMNAVEEMMGIDRSRQEDPAYFERVPEWVQEMGLAQVGGNDNILQKILGTQNPVYGGVNLPTTDLNRIGTPVHMAQQMVQDVRPEVKIPMELTTGRQAFSGAPLPETEQYVAQQLPIPNLIRKILDEEKRGEGVGVGSDIWNWLTGVGLQEITPQRQQSELRRQQQPLQEIIGGERKENLDEFLKELKQSRNR